MELWIRSQDREDLIEVHSVEVDIKDKIKIITLINANTIIDLGIYKSKERALEVLDEIQYKIQCMNDDFYYKEGYETDTKVYDGYKKQHKDMVYQMPEE